MMAGGQKWSYQQGRFSPHSHANFQQFREVKQCPHIVRFRSHCYRYNVLYLLGAAGDREAKETQDRRLGKVSGETRHERRGRR